MMAEVIHMHAAQLNNPHKPHGDDEMVAKRAGRRVRQWRLAQQPLMSQIAFATLAKISTGCLQAFERGMRATQDVNVKKIAKTMGWTVEQLYDDDAQIQQGHPLLRDLKKEDYLIAISFHHAIADLKFAVKGLLNERIDEALRERHARALVSMQLLHVDLLLAVENLIVAWKVDDEASRAANQPAPHPRRKA
jgi:hypothetical protein